GALASRGRSAAVAEVGLLHELASPVERPPPAALPATLEPAASDPRSVRARACDRAARLQVPSGAEDPPLAVHLALEVRALESDVAVGVAVDRRNGLRIVGHAAKIARRGWSRGVPR